MRFQSSIFVSLTLAASAALGQATPVQAAPVQTVVPKGAVSFTSKSQAFAVWMPAKPVQNEQTIKVKSGHQAKVSIFQTQSKGVSYLIVSVYAPTAPKAVRGDLDIAQRNFLRSSGGTLQRRQDIQLGGYKGRDLRLKSGIGRPVRTRMFDTPKYVYQLVAQGETAPMKTQAAQVNRFFDSFRILK